MSELNKIHLGHVLEVLKQIDDESIDCCVTSPPYYGLRSYGTEPQIWLNGTDDCEEHEWANKNKKWHSGTNAGKKQLTSAGSFHNDFSNQSNFCKNCNAWKGDLGLEPTFELYLVHLWQIFDEIKRVLKKTGTCFVNIGDSYSGSGKGIGTDRTKCKEVYTDENIKKTNWDEINIPAKSLLGIPERFMIGMVDRGWIRRNTIIWYKRNCMPSSAKDRFTVDFEFVYFFVKNSKYYFEQQFEETLTYDDSVRDRDNSKLNNTSGRTRMAGLKTNNYSMRNKRCVWDIPPTPFSEAHFAVFPQELVLPMIKAGCPEFICDKCGQPREKIYEAEGDNIGRSWHDHTNDLEKGMCGRGGIPQGKYQRIDKGYTDCKCEAGFHPGTVLDPFIGSGTTGIVANKLNRNFIGIDLKEEYLKMAEKRMDKELGFFKGVVE